MKKAPKCSDMSTALKPTTGILAAETHAHRQAAQAGTHTHAHRHTGSAGRSGSSNIREGRQGTATNEG